jgi:hypothetical protein
MKLFYEDVEVGTLTDVNGDMGREYGTLLLSVSNETSKSEIEEKLFRWINIENRLSDIRREKSENDFYEDEEAKKLFAAKDELPNYMWDKNWKLVYEKTGKSEKIHVAQFSGGKVYWSIDLSHVNADKKSETVIFGLSSRSYNILVVIACMGAASIVYWVNS